MDAEKAFDSLHHKFSISVLNKFGFGQNFISWKEIILKNQESCVINGGITTKYFNLNKGARQGDLISVYLLILELEILFLLIKENHSKNGLNIFDHCYLYFAYADDTTFFLRDIPINTPRVFHVETTWKRPFLRRFNVEYTWCDCRDQFHKRNG